MQLERLRRGAGGGNRTGGAGAQVNVFANISNALNRANLEDAAQALVAAANAAGGYDNITVALVGVG